MGDRIDVFQVTNTTGQHMTTAVEEWCAHLCVDKDMVVHIGLYGDGGGAPGHRGCSCCFSEVLSIVGCLGERSFVKEGSLQLEGQTQAAFVLQS